MIDIRDIRQVMIDIRDMRQGIDQETSVVLAACVP